MQPTDFLRILYNAKGLLGNSSVGIRECAFLGVPAINIGSRQFRRDRGNNVVEVDYNSAEIEKAINKIIHSPRPAISNIYGGGNAGERIADVLATIPLRFHKTITF